MAYIDLSNENIVGVKIMIFAEGTILKPKRFFTLYHHKSYLPIGNAPSLIEKWMEQGATILYCTSRKGKQAMEMAELLQAYNFQGTRLYYREKKEKYKDLVEIVQPDILIEDDCKSIGGSWQMCITQVNPKMKNLITSIAVKEFKGIDHLPTNLKKLKELEV